MKNITRIVTFLIIMTYTGASYAHDFVNFKLKGDLKKLNQINFKQQFHGEKDPLDLQRGVQNLLVESDLNNKASLPLAPILNEISGLLTDNYEDIGLKQAQRLVDTHDIGGGVENFSGFTWYKPMLNYSIRAHRELAPELYSDRWIVHDTFTIYIEAMTLLTNMKDKGLIDITKAQLGAFAGLSFSRVYHYYSFSDTYLNGLKKDFSKLFLTPFKYNISGVHSLDEYEFMKRSDTFNFNAGGAMGMPPTNGLSGKVGVFVGLAYKNELLIHKVGQEDKNGSNDYLRFSLDKTVNKKAGVNLTLQYDFFNLLKLTLLTYELDYSYAKSAKLYMSILDSDKARMDTEGDDKNEMKAIISGSQDTALRWRDRITSYEKRIKENLSSKFSFLILGSIKKRATEQFILVREGIEKVFYKNYSESIKYIQSFFSRLFSTVIQKIFNFSTTVKNRAEIKKNFIIEYEHMTDAPGANVDSPDKFSIRLKHHFYVHKTHRWYHRMYYNSALRNVKKITHFNSDLYKKLKDKTLRGPLTLNTTLEVEKSGLNYFNKLDVERVIDASLKVCSISKSKRKSYYSEKRRKRIFKSSRTGKKRCAKKLITRYFTYINNYDSLGMIDLNQFKSFVGYYFSKSKSLQDIYNIFGHDNVFSFGSMSATTKSGQNFQNFFKNGNFRGLGVIEKFKREGNLTPMSIKSSKL